MAGGKIVELNNGEKLEVGYFGGSRAKLLLDILENVKERLSYIPNLEDAKRIPDMPKDMGLYNRYFGSYEKACKELVRREERKSRWRKMTDEEKAYLKEIESREKVSHYRERYLEQIHSKERGDNMKKPQVTPEKHVPKSTRISSSLMRRMDFGARRSCSTMGTPGCICGTWSYSAPVSTGHQSRSTEYGMVWWTTITCAPATG